MLIHTDCSHSTQSESLSGENQERSQVSGASFDYMIIPCRPVKRLNEEKNKKTFRKTFFSILKFSSNITIFFPSKRSYT